MITEDDLLSRIMLCDLLADNFPEVFIVYMAPTVRESILFLCSNKIDLLFLDIELPDGNGLDILKRIKLSNFRIIITTSYPEYTNIPICSGNLLGLLVKPVTISSLKEVMKKYSCNC